MKKYRFSKNQIPNYISVFRILLIPVYVLTFFDQFIILRFMTYGPCRSRVSCF